MSYYNMGKFNYPFTCPIINSNIDDIKYYIEDIVKEVVQYTIDNRVELDEKGLITFVKEYLECNKIYDEYFDESIENIRESNQKMRESVECIIEDIEYEVNNKIEEIELLEDNISELNDKLDIQYDTIKDLESVITDLKNELEYKNSLIID